MLKMHFSVYILLYLVRSGYCYGNLLEFSDFSDNLANIWNNRFASTQPMKCTLQSSVGTTEGICRTRTQCLLSGGVPAGRCGLLSTCCTYGRVRTTNTKISYFSSSDVQFTDSPVSFNVIRMNEDVCQLRLDFLEFDLALATLIGTTPQTIYQCATDNFYILPGPNIPQICGPNTGQHLYVNMPRGMRNVSLNVKFAPRINDLPRWNIKVTQLQCPRTFDKIITIDHGVGDDYLMLAPQGCLQYFVKDSGNIKSFGYVSSTVGGYTANQYYSICFRRTEYYCAVSFSFRDIRLNTGGSPTTCRDFLMIPGLEINNQVAANNKLCPNTPMPSPTNATSRPPGPLHIDFYADNNNAIGGFDVDFTMDQCIY